MVGNHIKENRNVLSVFSLKTVLQKREIIVLMWSYGVYADNIWAQIQFP